MLGTARFAGQAMDVNQAHAFPRPHGGIRERVHRSRRVRLYLATVDSDERRW